MKFTALGPLTLGALPWRTYSGGAFLSVIAKATLDLVPNAEAKLTTPVPLVLNDLHYESNRGRSLYVASDLAPYKPRADVMLVGHAYAPPGVRVTQRVVQLGVGEHLRKRILVVGSRWRDPRSGAVSSPEPWTRMPLRYELAYGGRLHAENPIGLGADPSDARLPTLLDPVDPTATTSVGFGPLGASSWTRRNLLGRLSPQQLTAAVPLIPEQIEWAYFGAAPHDQQLAGLVGNEWITLSGVHPVLPEVASQLPGAHVRCCLVGGAWNGDELALRLDTAWIDADQMRVVLTWRGVVPLRAAAFEQMDAAELIASLHRAEKPAAPSAEAVHAISHESDDDERTVIRKDMALVQDFDGDDERTLIPGVVLALPDIEMVASEATDEPSPRASAHPASMQPSFDLSAQSAAHDDVVHTVEVNLRDVWQSAQERDAPFPLAPASVDGEDERDARELPWAIALHQPPVPRSDVDETLVPIAQARTTPRIEDYTGELAERGEYAPPERTTENVPIVNLSPFVAWTIPWQVRPPRDSLTIAVKGTFDIVRGGRATLAKEQEPPLGDVTFEGANSLRHASDFPIFKPRADVTLVGHAYSRKANATASMVGLKFGSSIDRSVAVFGDREWDRVGAQKAPRRFERMPLVYERACGGEGIGENPVGVDLPNLESPKDLIKGRGDRRAPACFGPLSPTWQPRSAKLGTYNARWRATRWPYFPDDFDWAHFQAAPAEQQTNYPSGDEYFELGGIHSEHRIIEGQMPGVRVRAFAQMSAGAGGGFFEVILRIDSVHFDADALRLTVVWRGLIESNDQDASEVATLCILHDHGEQKLPLEAARTRLFVALAAQQTEQSDAANDTEKQTPPSLVVEALAATLGRVAERRRIDVATDNSTIDAGRTIARSHDRTGIDVSADDSTIEALPSTPGDAPAVEAIARARVLEMLDAREPLAGADLSGADLHDLDLSGLDLSGAILQRADLSGANLRGAHLAEAVLEHSNCCRAIFDQSDLTGAALSEADLSDASFASAQMSGATVNKALCVRTRFDAANADGASFAEARLEEASFRRASLRGADLVGCAIDRAIFDEATLDDAKLYGSTGETPSFNGASLVDLRADDVVLESASCIDVRANGSVWEGARLRSARFDRAVLDEASFVRACLDGAVFTGASARQARFRKAKLARADCRGANLMQAAFDGADLTHVDFRGANLYRAETWQAKTSASELAGALIAGTKLKT